MKRQFAVRTLALAMAAGIRAPLTAGALRWAGAAVTAGAREARTP